MEGTYLKKNIYINGTNDPGEQADLELYETVSVDDDIYENTGIAVSVLEKPNSGLSEKCETLQTAPQEEQKIDSSKVATCTTCQKVMLLIFVLASVLMSSVSLVIALTIHLRVEAAVDGSWSDWASWETCSTTCDVGLQTRHRNCSSPAPLGHGRQCLGEDSEHRLCMPGPCSNGSWSAWGSWGSCSVSCDVGLKSRLRICTHPRPSVFGSSCEGDNMQAEICGREPCSETRVAFNVYQYSATGISDSHTVIFTNILLNEGGAYNQTDGLFTAPFSGLYQFNGQICTVVGKNAEYTLTIEGKSFASGEYRTPSDAGDGKCTSFSAVVSVLRDQRVWITSQHLFANDNDWNSFSGILIHKT
ncbi:thrombospondin-1-like [Mercenaria mercenaria]|uniref:thrombospondin-1-like n=1 Tax=Mercenaria mercenaria TaxID=6596 RepID=UPI00234E6DCB|nr:thrombospondin-1-like [Mercenaria mercenaria]